MKIRFVAACASLALFAVALPGLAAAQDVEAGQKSFNKCRACHQIGEGAKNVTGPHLNGLFSRKAGEVPGYAYSAANKNSGIAWSPESFANYIKDPRGVIPNTKMVFPGIKNETEIANLTAFLAQYAPDGKKK